MNDLREMRGRVAVIPEVMDQAGWILDLANSLTGETPNDQGGDDELGRAFRACK